MAEKSPSLFLPSHGGAPLLCERINDRATRLEIVSHGDAKSHFLAKVSGGRGLSPPSENFRTQVGLSANSPLTSALNENKTVNVNTFSCT